jgi:RNA polymerase sigma factor (TIGR02999 family)
MQESQEERIAQVLAAAEDGDFSAAEQLLPLVYEELRKLAHYHMANEPPGHTMTATALVHEAYVRLIGDGAPEWDGCGHFFAAAARAMRRILIERARRQGQIKRGGGRRRVPLGEVAVITEALPAELLELDGALTRLEDRDSRKSEVVNLRYFAGLTVEETARAMGISPRLVNKEWTFARAWLMRELSWDA